MRTALYIHIPFCRSKCTYCDFFSVPLEGGVPDSYIDAVCREILFRMRQFGADGWGTVYIGGGTPSLLSEKQFGRLFDFLCSCGTAPDECTVELNPDDITKPLLEALRRFGVRRISVGVQAMEQSVLAAVKRRASIDTTERALGLIQNSWDGIFSADMICALPGQTETSFLSGLERLLQYEPEHISLYSLSVEEKTPLGKAVYDGFLPYDFDAADKLWISGRDFLERCGFCQYEVSNFYNMRTGEPCAHNLVYWQLRDYIGAGSGATGSLYGKKSMRYTNVKNPDEYIRFWQHYDGADSAAFSSVPQELERIDTLTERFEFFMMGLRTADGICAEEFRNRFGASLPRNFLRAFSKWQADGRAELRKRDGSTFYALNHTGMLFLNRFLEEIL